MRSVSETGNVIRIYLSYLQINDDDLNAIASWNAELDLALETRDVRRMLRALENYFNAMRELLAGHSAPSARRPVVPA